MAEVSSSSADVKISPEKVKSEAEENEQKILENDDSEILRKGESKEEEETASDGEFIKVEKELIDVKKSSNLLNPILGVQQTSHEVEVRFQELQHQLEDVAKDLKHSEKEKDLLKAEVDHANEKLNYMSKHCQELERDQETMKIRILEAEKKYDLQFNTLQEALTTKDLMHNELLHVKETSTGLSSELEISRKRVKELEEELKLSAAEVYKLDELQKQNGSQAEVESRKARELEEMLELTQNNSKKMEHQIDELQKELKGFQDKDVENKQVGESLLTTRLELSSAQEQLQFARSQVAELGQKLVSSDAAIQEISQELNLQKCSEKQLRTDVLSLEKLLSVAKEDLQTKVTGLVEVELKLQEQLKDKEAFETQSWNQENQISKLQSDLSYLNEQNATLQTTIADLKVKLLENEELCSQLESKLDFAQQNSRNTDSLLSEASSYKDELEQKLKTLEELYQESRTVSEFAMKRNVELEDLIEVSNATEESLKEQLKESKLKLEASREDLNAANVERTKSEHMSITQEKKLSEAEQTIQLLQSDLKSLISQVKSMEEDLKASKDQEKVLLDKLNYAQEQIEHQQKEADEATIKNLELKALHETLLQQTKLEHQKAAASLKEKESEAKELHEMLKSQEEVKAFYEAQAVEASETLSALKSELEVNVTKLTSLESTIDELKRKVMESDQKSERTFSENESLIKANLKLQEDVEAYHLKVNELNDLLKSIHIEKEAASEEITSHVKTIENLTDKNSRGLELQIMTESRLKEAEMQLHEANEKLEQKILEAVALNEKLEETLLKFKDLEGLVEQWQNKSDQLKAENEGLARENLNLSRELTTCEMKSNELQLELNKVLEEKEDISVQLLSLRKEVEFMQQIASVNEKHQSQITSLTEENNILNEKYQKVISELETTILQLEEKANERKEIEIIFNADMESLKKELEGKSLLQAQNFELEQKLVLAENRYNDEIESMRSDSLKKDAAFSSKLEEHASILQERDALHQQLSEIQNLLDISHRTMTKQTSEESEKPSRLVAELVSQLDELHRGNNETAQENAKLRNMLQQANERTEELEKDNSELERLRMAIAGGNNELLSAGPKDVMDIKTRDFVFDGALLSKIKDTTDDAVPKTPRTESVRPAAQVAPKPSGDMTFKFVLGIALVSVVIGIVLGKRY